jgi:hypothetical protein
MRRNTPVRSINEPRRPITFLRLRTGSGSLADASNVALTLLGVVAFQVKPNRAYLKANPGFNLETKSSMDLAMLELRHTVRVKTYSF